MFLEWRLQGKALTDLRFTPQQLDSYRETHQHREID
jgi:hypothetical protein